MRADKLQYQHSDQIEQSGYRPALQAEVVRSIICVSDLFWDEHWSSEQQLMSRLSHNCKVLYIERPVSLLSSFTGVSDASIGRQWRRWLFERIRKENDNLTIVTPAPVLPLRYNRIVNKMNGWLLRRSIRHAVRKLGLEASVLWIYSPDAGEVVGALNETYCLYYCADDWSASQQWWNNSNQISAREAELASKADLIVGTSTKIVKRWQGNGHKTMPVTNGADLQIFKMARDPNLSIPGDLEAIPTPRIGYVGCIDTRFDSLLFLQLAQKHPEWHFVVVGPLSGSVPHIGHLKALNNVHFLGSKAKTELPHYLKFFDVCTIPYIIDKLSESIFPLKLFEYLAAGRPIVSTGLPELLAYQNYVHVAQNLVQFEQGILESLKDPLPLASDAFLNANSWDAKATALWETLQQEVGARLSHPRSERL